MKRKTKTVPKKRMLKAKFVINLDSVLFLPPPTTLEKCPRCEKPHKRFKPLRFKRPMQFWRKNADGQPKLVDQASHWFLCPRTKEPVILFDKVDAGEALLNAVTEQSVKDICAEEDKKFLDGISTWTASYKVPKKGKKGKKGKPEEMRIEATFGPATTWVYDPNAPSRMVPGTEKEAAAQAKRVKAQEKAAKGRKR